MLKSLQRKCRDGRELSEKNAELEANSKTVFCFKLNSRLEETHQNAAALAKKNEESLASRLSKTEAELNQLSTSSGVTREELERMETALAKASSSKDAAEEKSAELQNKVHQLTRNHDADLQRQKAAHDQIRQQHQKELMAIENRSSELEAELNELRQTLGVQAEHSRTPVASGVTGQPYQFVSFGMSRANRANLQTNAATKLLRRISLWRIRIGVR